MLISPRFLSLNYLNRMLICFKFHHLFKLHSCFLLLLNNKVSKLINISSSKYYFDYNYLYLYYSSYYLVIFLIITVIITKIIIIKIAITINVAIKKLFAKIIINYMFIITKYFITIVKLVIIMASLFKITIKAN